MAVFIPFRGVRYNPEVIHDFLKVICPPYDVISPEMQKQFYDRHENNFVRVELGKDQPGDTASDNRYSRACDYLSEWQKKGILIRDAEPSFYLYRLTYRGPNVGTKTLSGIIALVEVEEPESRMVLPHEKTFPKAKKDRLQLLHACHANTSPIYTLYRDKYNDVVSVFEKTIDIDRPLISFQAEDQIQHRLWQVSDPKAQNVMIEQLKDQPLLIADGHHRYETAVRFKKEMAERTGASSPQPYNAVMMFCVGLSDPGMTLLPIHRVILNSMAFDYDGIKRRLGERFEIHSLKDVGMDEDQSSANFFRELGRLGLTKTAFGMVSQEEPYYQILVLKEDPLSSKPLNRLDVSRFQSFILEEVFGVEDVASKKEGQVAFVKDGRVAVKKVKEGEAGIAFFLNATGIDEIQQVVQGGDLMPQKSTYFYPKPQTGLILNVF